MLALVALSLILSDFAHAEMLSPVWVELGEGGRAIARVIVSAPQDCPSVQINANASSPAVAQAMLLRQPVPAGFRPVCELALPANIRSATVNGKPLPLPRPDPSRIVVFGDTGCRIKGAELQACNDPNQWPFETVGNAAARARPDLVIHVGDYLYREDPCPAGAQALCAGTPSGDNWGAWNADFFKPAANLLAAAPWVFVRGNHEDCQRSWRGWFYYLDPRPWTGACAELTAPYLIQLGSFQMVDFDSAAANDNRPADPQVAVLSTQLATIHARNAWLVDHHPFWGLRTAADNSAPIPETVVLQRAWDKVSPKGIDMVVSGHTHLFEVLSYGPERPLQIVAGDGGTALAKSLPPRLNGTDVHGVMVNVSENRRAFGYTLFTKRGGGWDMRLTDLNEEPLVTCRIERRQAKCGGQVTHVSSVKSR